MKSLHKTIKNPSNLECILPGMWMPELRPGPNQVFDQALFNFGTYLLVMHWKNERHSFDQSHTNVQQLFTKFNTICMGPPQMFEFDCFFAALQNQIALFTYNKDEKLFVRKAVFNLDPLLVDPTQIYYFSNRILISCDHGGLGLYQIDEMQLKSTLSSESFKPIKILKTKGLVYAPVMQLNNKFSRLEGYYHRTYDALTLESNTTLNLKLDDMSKCQLAVPFNDSVIYFFSNPQFKCYFYNGQVNKLFDYNQIEDKFIDWVQLNPQTILFLTDKSRFFTYDIMNNFLEVRSAKKLPNQVSFNRIILFKQNVFFAINSYDSYIFSWKGGQLIPETTKLVIGRKNIVISKMKNKVIQMISAHNKAVTVTRCGPRFYYNPHSNPPPDNEIVAIYSQPISEYDTLIVVSLKNSSMIYKHDMQANGGQLMDYKMNYFIPNIPTTGFGVIAKDGRLCYIQASMSGYIIFDESRIIEQSKVQIKRMATDVVSRQMWVAITDSGQSFFFRNNKTQQGYENRLDIEITSASFSSHINQGYQSFNPNAPTPQFLLLTCTNRVIVYSIDSGLQSSATYPSGNENENKVRIAPKSSTWLDGNTFVVGLQGSIFIFRVRMEGSNIFLNVIFNALVGDGPVNLCQTKEYYGYSVLAYGTRSAHINLAPNGVISIKHISCPKINCLAPLFRWCVFAQEKVFGLMMYEGVDLFIYFSPGFQTRDMANSLDISQILTCDISQSADKPGIDILTTTRKGIYTTTGYDTHQLTNTQLYLAPDDEEIIASKLDAYQIAWISHRINPNMPEATIIRSAPLIVKDGMLGFFQEEYSKKLNVVTTRVYGNDDKSLPDTMFPHIVCAGGSTVVLFAVYKKGAIHPLTRLEKCGTNITALAFYNDKLIVGDQNTGILIYKYSDTANTFEPITAASRNMRQHITSISVYPQNGMVTAGDRFGNVIHFNADTFMRPLLFRSSNLLFENCFNVGDPIVGTQIVAMPERKFHMMWYATISGGVGVLALGVNVNNIITMLEPKVAECIYEMTGVNPLEKRNKQYPSSNVIDFDIVEMFADLSQVRQEKIVSLIKAKIESASSYAGNDGHHPKPLQITVQICIDCVSKYLSYFAL